MGYKQIGKNLSFADLAVSKSLKHNRSLKMMENATTKMHFVQHPDRHRFMYVAKAPYKLDYQPSLLNYE